MTTSRGHGLSTWTIGYDKAIFTVNHEIFSLNSDTWQQLTFGFPQCARYKCSILTRLYRLVSNYDLHVGNSHIASFHRPELIRKNGTLNTARLPSSLIGIYTFLLDVATALHQYDASFEVMQGFSILFSEHRIHEQFQFVQDFRKTYEINVALSDVVVEKHTSLASIARASQKHLECQLQPKLTQQFAIESVIHDSVCEQAVDFETLQPELCHAEAVEITECLRYPAATRVEWVRLTPKKSECRGLLQTSQERFDFFGRVTKDECAYQSLRRTLISGPREDKQEEVIRPLHIPMYRNYKHRRKHEWS